MLATHPSAVVTHLIVRLPPRHVGQLSCRGEREVHALAR